MTATRRRHHTATGRALALAARRTRRRRHHPRPPDRRLRDRLPPRPAPLRTAAQRRPSTTATTTTPRPPHRPTSPRPGPVTVTPALVARGKTLYTSDGCSACHSLTGAAGAGPSFKGLAGSTITLTNGANRHRRRRLPRALDRRPRRADRQGLPRRPDGPGDRELRPRRQTRRHPRPRRVHQVAEVVGPGLTLQPSA